MGTLYTLHFTAWRVYIKLLFIAPTPAFSCPQLAAQDFTEHFVKKEAGIQDLNLSASRDERIFFKELDTIYRRDQNDKEIIKEWEEKNTIRKK